MLNCNPYGPKDITAFMQKFDIGSTSNLAERFCSAAIGNSLSYTEDLNKVIRIMEKYDNMNNKACLYMDAYSKKFSAIKCEMPKPEMDLTKIASKGSIESLEEAIDEAETYFETFFKMVSEIFEQESSQKMYNWLSDMIQFAPLGTNYLVIRHPNYIPNKENRKLFGESTSKFTLISEWGYPVWLKLHLSQNLGELKVAIRTQMIYTAVPEFLKYIVNYY